MLVVLDGSAMDSFAPVGGTDGSQESPKNPAPNESCVLLKSQTGQEFFKNCKRLMKCCNYSFMLKMLLYDRFSDDSSMLEFLILFLISRFL